MTFVIKTAIKTVTSLSAYEKVLGALSTIKKDCYAQLRLFVTRKQNFCATVVNKGSENCINTDFYTYDPLCLMRESYYYPNFFCTCVGAHYYDGAPHLGKFSMYFRK